MAATKKSTTAKADSSAAAETKASPEVQARVDEATEKGFIGREVDDTPNENYTLAGVTAGKPTPETKKRS